MGSPSPTAPSLSLWFHSCRGKLLTFLIPPPHSHSLCCRSSIPGSCSWEQSSLPPLSWNIGSLIAPSQLSHRVEVLCQKRQKEKSMSCHSHPSATHVTSGKTGYSPQLWCSAAGEEREKGDSKDKDLQLCPFSSVESTKFICNRE